MSQIEKIVNYMLKFGEITQRDAIYLGCYRLASRIHEIKKLGTPINTEMREVKNKDGSTSRIAVYTLAEEEGEDVED